MKKSDSCATVIKNTQFTLTFDNTDGRILSFCSQKGELLSKKQPILFQVCFRTQAGKAVLLSSNNCSFEGYVQTQKKQL